MVRGTRRRRKRAPIQFAEPPWSQQSPQWQELERQVPADHVARQVVQAVQRLDLTPLFDCYLGTGSLPLRPDLLLTVALIETHAGRMRPAQWHRDTRENLVLQWAGMGICPSRTCWYDFADRAAPFLDGWIRATIDEAKRREITRAQRGSLDGSAVAASASRHRLLNQTRVKQRLMELERACLADAKDEPPAQPPAWMAKTAATRRRQRDRYEQAQQRLVELHANNARQEAKKRRMPEKVVVSVSEPEAALGRDKHNVFRPLYNVQLVRDLDSPLYLAYQVFAQPTDAGTFGLMSDRIAQWTGRRLSLLLVDAGYVTACNLALCQQWGTALYGPWKENDLSKQKKAAAKPRPIGKEHFTWLPDENAYRCPEGHPMPWIGQQKRRQADGEINVMHSYRCAPQHCRGCPRQPSCCCNPNRGRSVKRSEHESLVEAHRTRMATPEAKSLYRLRKQTVELGFADLKQHRALRQFTARGLARAQRQVGMAVLIHNLLVLQRATPPPSTPPPP